MTIHQYQNAIKQSKTFKRFNEEYYVFVLVKCLIELKNDLKPPRSIGADSKRHLERAFFSLACLACLHSLDLAKVTLKDCYGDVIVKLISLAELNLSNSIESQDYHIAMRSLISQTYNVLLLIAQEFDLMLSQLLQKPTTTTKFSN